MFSSLRVFFFSKEWTKKSCPLKTRRKHAEEKKTENFFKGGKNTDFCKNYKSLRSRVRVDFGKEFFCEGEIS